MAKIYYETAQFELLDSSLHAFNMFVVRRKEISGFEEKGYLALIKFVDNLMKLKIARKTISKKELILRYNKLKNKIIDAENIISKSWVLEKLEELNPDTNSIKQKR